MGERDGGIYFSGVVAHDGTYSYVKELRGEEMLGGRPMQPKGG